MSMTVEALREELEFFAERKKELIEKCSGQFALIKGRSLVGVFPTRAEAYTAGFRRFLREPFLVKQILEHEETEQIPLLAQRLQRADL